MAAQRGGSKATQRVRKLDGQVVRSVLFNGKAAGMGKYFAAEVNGKLLMDEQGVPLKFNEVGNLE